MQDNAPHILVIDDDARLAALLKQYLSENGYRISVAENAEEAGKKMVGVCFDLLILDRMMPGTDGLTFARDLREKSNLNQSIPILMLTAMAEPSDRIDGLEVGVDDYLSKPFEPRELLLRTDAILRRARRETISEIQFGDFVFDLTRGELLQKDELVNLTSSEQVLLKTLAASPGVPVTREQLSLSSGSQGRAVDVQITRLRRKIEEDPKMPRYLQTVRGEGYILWAD
jgi:two-component system, OmpR family, phosphate regulon response regulator OmpR